MSYINPFRILTPQSKKAFTSDTSKNRSIFGFGNFEAVQSLIASNNYNKCDISFVLVEEPFVPSSFFCVVVQVFHTLFVDFY